MQPSVGPFNQGSLSPTRTVSRSFHSPVAQRRHGAGLRLGRPGIQPLAAPLAQHRGEIPGESVGGGDRLVSLPEPHQVCLRR